MQTVFYISVDKDNLAEQIGTINCELQTFSEWCRKNKVTLNVDKTNCVLFSLNLRKRELIQGSISLIMDGKKLKFVDSFCYLGVDLDQCLTMNNHLEKVIRKTRPLLYKLGRLRYYIDAVTVTATRSRAWAVRPRWFSYQSSFKAAKTAKQSP